VNIATPKHRPPPADQLAKVVSLTMPDTTDARYQARRLHAQPRLRNQDRPP
jgi:hypothetical protein